MQEPTPTKPVIGRTKRRLAVLLTASCGLLLAGAGTAAFAVIGGGYSPGQQGCPGYASDYDTPHGLTYAGCHNTQLSVESGQTNGGNPSNDNTKYVQVGEDQAPVDPNSQGTPTIESVGEPGYSGSPHGFCVQANTDGTNQPPASTPEQQNKAIADGCKDNPNGAGFAENIDYYTIYCPIAAAAGNPCEASGYGGAPGSGVSGLAPTVDTGTGQKLTPVLQNGLIVYFGMDDNNDNGEHDGVGPYCSSTSTPSNPNPTQPDCPKATGAVNGSSDGGALMLALTPMGVTNTPSQTNPEGIANFSTGFCADGICAEGTTQQQTVYHGCDAAPASSGHAHGKKATQPDPTQCASGTPSSSNVYDYAPGGNPNNDPSVNNESANCNSGDPTTTNLNACGPGGMDYWRAHTPQNVNAEPGVQVYTDPDPQRSPAAPAPFWPTPGLYVGTCGVYAGSPATTGQIPGFTGQSVQGHQITNAAGQLAIDPNPSVC